MYWLESCILLLTSAILCVVALLYVPSALVSWFHGYCKLLFLRLVNPFHDPISIIMHDMFSLLRVRHVSCAASRRGGGTPTAYDIMNFLGRRKDGGSTHHMCAYTDNIHQENVMNWNTQCHLWIWSWTKEL